MSQSDKTKAYFAKLDAGEPWLTDREFLEEQGLLEAELEGRRQLMNSWEVTTDKSEADRRQRIIAEWRGAGAIARAQDGRLYRAGQA